MSGRLKIHRDMGCEYHYSYMFIECNSYMFIECDERLKGGGKFRIRFKSVDSESTEDDRADPRRG